MLKIYSKLYLTLSIILFLSVFIFARALVSIPFIIIILMYIISGEASLEGFRRNKSLYCLLIAGIFINIGIFYVSYVTKTFEPKSFFGFSNPLVILLYIYSSTFFLRKNKDYGEYLLVVYSTIVIIFSIFACYLFIYHCYFVGNGFIVSDIYKKDNGGSIIQSIVALTFPLTAVYLVLKTKKIKNKAYKLTIYFFSALVIFVDIFVNRSKVGYLIEFIVLIYYVYALVSYFREIGSSNFKKDFLIIMVGILSIVGLFVVVYKESSVFNDRVSKMYNETSSYFNADRDEKETNELMHSSTGLRMMYYISSFKLLKEYPDLLIFGCPYKTNTVKVKSCTATLISKSDRLKNEVDIAKNGIMPHDEFINYVFRGGIVAGASLLMFFVLLFYESKKLKTEDKICMRVLLIAILAGCTFDYFMTTQMLVALFATLLSIFLSKQLTGEEDVVE